MKGRVMLWVVLAVVFLGMLIKDPLLVKTASAPDRDLEEEEKLLPEARACAPCHLSVTRELALSVHGKARLDCSSCHTFHDEVSADPGDYTRGRFYRKVRMAECERCHGIQVNQWRAGKHVHPLNTLFARLSGASRWDYTSRTPVGFGLKRANPCLNCHPPHLFKPGIRG